MDNIQAIIDTLTVEEQKEFSRFIQRNKHKKTRVDLNLYQLILQARNSPKNDFFIELYGESGDRNAYHSVRKRLVKHLNDFIYLKMIDNDESLEAEINKDVTLIRHLFSNNLDKLAWKYIHRAEKMAKRSELNLQLQMIYDLQIEHFKAEKTTETLANLVKARQVVAELAAEDQNLKIIGSFVNQELKKVKLKGYDLDLEKILDLLLNTFNMKDSLFRRPKLRYNFVQIARQIILANKEFYAFEDYIIDNFNKIERSGHFKTRPSHKLNMLYIISHTLYRNKKFDEALIYLNRMGELLKQVPKGTFNTFNVKFNLLWAACENFNGNLQASIHVLEDLMAFRFLQREDLLNAQLNLSVYYFQSKNYRMANKVLVGMGHTDKWYEKNMGVEWRIKKGLIEIIYQIELENTEIAFDRIKFLQRSYKAVFNLPKYSRVAVFLVLIGEVIKSPHKVRTEAFKKKVGESFDWVEKDQEDLQAMSYYAWLKSKMEGKDFYVVLRDLLLRK